MIIGHIHADDNDASTPMKGATDNTLGRITELVSELNCASICCSCHGNGQLVPVLITFRSTVSES